jgi:hypothetical protein
MTTPTTTQKELDRLLTPDDLLDKPDPLAGTIGELTPDALRGGEDPEPDELPAKVKAPLDLISEQLKEVGEAMPKLFKAREEILEKEQAAEKAEHVSIREWIRKAAAERELTPDDK